jgi:hypothetical protein
MDNVLRNTLNATETSCATVQRNTIYETLRTNLSEKNAKQTQFPKKSNEPKYLFTNSLQKYNRLPAGQKQTQFKPNSNPIQTQSCPP